MPGQEKRTGLKRQDLHGGRSVEFEGGEATVVNIEETFPGGRCFCTWILMKGRAHTSCSMADTTPMAPQSREEGRRPTARPPQEHKVLPGARAGRGT